MSFFSTRVSDFSYTSSETSVAFSTEHTFADKIRNGFVPMNGSTHPVDPEMRAHLLRTLGGIETKLPTLDGALLDAVWCPTLTLQASATVMIFHGNACTLDSMHDYAKWYKDRGLNVLLMTMRGYPGSTGDSVKAGELGFYRDAEACVRFALTQGIRKERLFGHGYSLGGALAAAAGRFFDLPMTLDHTFTSAEAVMRHIANPQVVLPEFVTQGIAKGTYPPGITCASSRMKTDSLNTLHKLQTSNKPFFIMSGKDDPLMPPDFALQFLQARCGHHPTEYDRKNHLAEIPGGHWGPFMDHPASAAHYERYLIANNLMDYHG